MTSPIDDSMRQEIDALLDGALPEEQAVALRVRIDGDAALRAEYERRRQAVELVRALPPVEAPEGFTASVLDRLPERPASATPARVRSLWLWGSGLAAAAALVIAVSIGDGDHSPSDDWTLAEEKTETSAEEMGGIGRVPGDPGAARKEAKDASERSGVLQSDLRALRERSGSLGKRPELESEMEPDAGISSTGSSTRGSDRRSEEAAPAKSGVVQEQIAGTRRADTETALLLRVEQARTVLTQVQRQEYLNRVARVSQAALLAHFDRIGRSSQARRSARFAQDHGRARPGTAKGVEPGKKETTGATPIAFECTVAKRAEAESLRTILTRAFPRASAPAATEKAARARAKPSVVVADLTRGESGELRLDRSMTADQAGTMAIWLERIGLWPPRGAGAVAPAGVRVGSAKRGRAGSKAIAGADDEDDDAGRSPPVSVRVRIRFGPQVRAPERPKGADR